MSFQIRIYPDKIDLGDEAAKEKLRFFAKRNPGIRAEIVPFLPDSRKQRRFYFGAILTLWAYLDGKDYKDSAVIEDLHEVAKLEFNAQIVVVKGKKYRVGKSTKGKLNQGYLERIIDYLEESYGIDRMKVLNPKHYKDFMDRIFSFSHYETYIDYLKELHYLS